MAALLNILGSRLQRLLIISFALIAALSLSLNTIVIARILRDYLSRAESERVSRDMDLAKEFYRLKLEEVAGISHRLSLDTWVVDALPSATEGRISALDRIDEEITNKITVLALGGTHVIVVLNPAGDIVTGRVLQQDNVLSNPIRQGDLSRLAIVTAAQVRKQELAATEVLPADILTQVGLAKQAAIKLIDTPQAAPEPFDSREGTAGLALVGISPIRDPENNLIGNVFSAYLFNNDFTLVDRIRQVAGIDTVTIFFGDLRVSTNVPNEQGERAVGTRVSKVVREQVLDRGEDYVGRAFVVNEEYITRYVPLFDHLGQVVGSLYVGARVSTFESLVQTFNSRVTLTVLVCIILAGVVAVPVSRYITRPITKLADANQRLAQGDMSVRVVPEGAGELSLLGHSFNRMASTLQETQEQLLHKERLASMGQLAAGVAHEINNPLGTILLFATALKRETADEDRLQDLNTIIQEATRCKSIVSDLLNFSRQQEVLAQPTDVNRLIEEVISKLRNQPSFEGVQIQCSLDPSLPEIEADPNQLQQVFVNLLNNAAEAVEGDGRIEIQSSTLDSGGIELHVTDNGCGIPEENLKRLFTPFFTTKALGKGTGLGLSIVYGIIKMHRGQIWVKSTVGEGTTFFITLPIRHEVHRPQSAGRSQEMEG
ncbi:MAG: cache domain-containing protein [Anaerolineales bacterium]